MSGTCQNIGHVAVERCQDCKRAHCNATMAGTLSRDEISDYSIIDTKVSEAKKCKSAKATTYDLRLGHAHLVSGLENGKPVWKRVFTGGLEDWSALNDGSAYPFVPAKLERILEIPAFGSALVQFEETIDTLSIAQEKCILVVGRFDLKLSLVNQALISQQATQVESCYKGKLFCFLHNLSSQPVKLKYLQRLATIEFSYVSCLCSGKKRRAIINELVKNNQEKYAGDYGLDGTGIRDVRWFPSEPNTWGLVKLYAKLKRLRRDTKRHVKACIKNDFFTDVVDLLKDRLEQQIRLRRMIGGWLVTLIIALIVALVTWWFTWSVTWQGDAIKELQSQYREIRQLQADVDSLKGQTIDEPKASGYNTGAGGESGD